MVALVKTTKGDRRLILDLGPQQALSKLNLSEGQRINAEGVVVRLRDHQVLVADRLKAGDQTIRVDRSAQMKARQGAKRQGPKQGDGQQRQNPSK